MLKTRIPDLDELEKALHYNADTGDMIWISPASKAVKPGDRAGTPHSRDGTIVVSYQGQRYQAHHLAWYLSRRTWPTTQIIFRDKDPTNLTADNLRSVAETQAKSASAAAARTRRAKRSARLLKANQEWSDRDIAQGYGVRFNGTQNTWDWHDPEDPKRIWGRFKTRTDAVAAAEEQAANMAWLFQNRYDPRHHRGDELIAAGTERGTHTYMDIAMAVAYNPTNGHFYWREGSSRGQRADFVNTSGRHVVSIFGRHLSTPMLAWFLSKRRWPKPKTIRHRNGDPADARLANLYEIGK